MEKEKVLAKVREIKEGLDLINQTISELEYKLSLQNELSQYECSCEVEYTGGHIWPCRGRG